MTTGWWWLIAAGLVEAVWSQTIKPTDNFTRPMATFGCFVLGAASVLLLSHAMQTLPVGTAYVVFTGLGGIGAIGLGVIFRDEPMPAVRAVGLAMVLVGIAVCRATDGA